MNSFRINIILLPEALLFSEYLTPTERDMKLHRKTIFLVSPEAWDSALAAIKPGLNAAAAMVSIARPDNWKRKAPEQLECLWTRRFMGVVLTPLRSWQCHQKRNRNAFSFE